MMMYDVQTTLKAVKVFIQTDSKGFPPKIGQINCVAKDVLLAEIRQREIETAKLPEPKGVQMPDEMRKLMEEVLKTL